MPRRDNPQKLMIRVCGVLYLTVTFSESISRTTTLHPVQVFAQEDSGVALPRVASIAIVSKVSNTPILMCMRSAMYANI